MHLVNPWFDRYFKNVAISFNDPVSHVLDVKYNGKFTYMVLLRKFYNNSFEIMITSEIN